uniref:Myb/SANT-like DNA-binding domain-containing protein n=1 Tax=Pseudonaja textilis TaxID=8673 RepID=A0A670ZI48_PSETE
FLSGPGIHRETLDFLALWGEESIQAQLNRCHRNADVYQWISERMAEKGYFRDEDQCRTKGKDLKKSYKQAKLQDGVARQRCRFFHELDAILEKQPRTLEKFPDRIIKQWNNLPPEVVDAPTLEVSFLPAQGLGLEDFQGPFRLCYSILTYSTLSCLG